MISRICTPASSRISLFQLYRGKCCLKSPGPRPTRRPQSAGGRGRGGRLTPRARLHPHLSGGADQRAPGPPRASSSLEQRRLQAFIPTVRGRTKTTANKKIRKDRIFPEINASNTIPIQSSWKSSSPPRVAFLLRRNNAETGVKSGLSKGEV